jgi:hypothetical protein
MLPTHNIYLIDLPLLVVLISLVYSATRFDEWSAILHESFRWGRNLLGFLGFITYNLYLLNSFNLFLAIAEICVLVIAFILYLVNAFQTRPGT